MPTYQYRCTACAEDLEAVQSFSEPALTECPACGGSLRKVFGSIGVVFKGSGFYKTDSRSNGKAVKDRPKEGAAAESSGTSSSASSSDSSTSSSSEKSSSSSEKSSSSTSSTGSTSGAAATAA